MSARLLAVFLCVAVGARASFTLDPITKRFLDSFGRERVFHGLNVVYKSYPYLPSFPGFDAQLSFGTQDMSYFKTWGLNIIRLGMEWPGAQPSADGFNDAYLAQAKLIVETAAKYNITTLLDEHQDCLAEVYCGEGAPDWAVTLNDTSLWDSFPLPFGAPFVRDNVTGRPSYADCQKLSWSDYQATFAGAAGYQQLYDSVQTNPRGQREAFGKFWARVASEFADSDAIIGYELINEPFAGDVWSNLLLWLPWVADSVNLQPFYDTVAPMLRASDNRSDHIVFFEPVTWSGLPILNNATVGFTHAPGGDGQAYQSGLAWHYYSLPNIGDQGDYFARRVKAASDLGVGSLVTEFDISDDVPTMTATMDVMDAHLLSWIGWEYKGFAGTTSNGTCTGCGRGPIYPNGTLDYTMIGAFSRTYAQAVAGTTLSMAFNSTDASFALQFTSNPNITAPTEIYLNEAVHYPSGFNCAVSPSASGKCVHSGTNSLFVYASSATPTNLTVTVTAA